MTRDDLIAFGKARHGEYWIKPLAEETGYDFSQIWRVAVGECDVSRRLEREIERLRNAT